MFNKISNYIKVQSYKGALNDLNTKKLPKNFVYFPLQVADDTNILLRSRYDNIASIKKTLAFADKKSMPLVIKLHPAEKSHLFLKELYDFLHTDKGI